MNQLQASSESQEKADLLLYNHPPFKTMIYEESSVYYVYIILILINFHATKATSLFNEMLPACKSDGLTYQKCMAWALGRECRKHIKMHRTGRAAQYF